jgi:hypothetical protein
MPSHNYLTVKIESWGPEIGEEETGCNSIEEKGFGKSKKISAWMCEAVKGGGLRVGLYMNVC